MPIAAKRSLLMTVLLDASSRAARVTGSMFDPEQAPSPRHALELVDAAVLEADFGLQHQFPDRARDQDFTGTRFGRDARADVKRETDHLAPAHLEFARMQPHPDLQSQRADGLVDCARTTDRGSWR